MTLGGAQRIYYLNMLFLILSEFFCYFLSCERLQAVTWRSMQSNLKVSSFSPCVICSKSGCPRFPVRGKSSYLCLALVRTCPHFYHSQWMASVSLTAGICKPCMPLHTGDKTCKPTVLALYNDSNAFLLCTQHCLSKHFHFPSLAFTYFVGFIICPVVCPAK